MPAEPQFEEPTFVKVGDAISASQWNMIVARLTGYGRPEAQVSRDKPLLGYNNSGSLIPAWSCFTIDTAATGTSGATIEPTVTLKKGSGKILFTNGQAGIATGTYGRIWCVSRDFPVKVLTNGTPTAIGSVCGPTSSDWIVTSGGTGLISLSTQASNVIWAIATADAGGAYIRIGKTSSQITARSGTTPGYGNVDEYSKNSGVLTDTTVDHVVYNPFNAIIPTATWITYEEHADGSFWVVGADCP